MCGRFTLAASAETITDYFQVSGNIRLTPRYNIAPNQAVLAIRQLINKPKEFTHFRWGFIPRWLHKENKHPAGWINARIESAAEKPLFRYAFKHQRCIIIADGFFEWKELARGKQPYYIHRKDNLPIAMAGIWEHWPDEEGIDMGSCAILTTQANDTLLPIHDRMPAIIQREHISTWLDAKNVDVQNLMTISTSYAGNDIEAYPVSPIVNKPSHDAPDCIIPLEI